MKILTLLLFAASGFSQNYSTVRIIPKADHSAVGSLEWRNQTDTHGVILRAPALSADISFSLPGVDGLSGQPLTTDGSGHLAFGNPTLIPPVTISGTTSGTILTVTQLGTGNALVALGPSAVQDNSSSNTAFTVTELGTADALHVVGNGLISGFLSQSSNNWTLSAAGLASAQDYTARYVFNSIGDVPQTGTVNTSGTTVTATSGTFDQSFVGGKLVICAGGCTATNGAEFLISTFIDSTHVTVATSPGTLTGAGYSYQANAFQTSQGTLQLTGLGFGLFQNVEVTNGFTSNGGGALTGTATWSGNDVLWASGSKFNPAMVGGSITVGATTTRVTGYIRDTHVTVLASLGSSSGSFSITPNAFQTSNGNIQLDSSGNATFGGALKDTGGIISITSSGSSSYTATGSSGGTASLMLAGNNSGNCWQNLANGSGSSFILGYTTSCGGAFSPTTEVTYTPTGVTFAQAITVPSCTGCSSGGVTSFNTRTGAVTLSSTDVTNAGANATFAVTSSSDASISATASTFATASLLLHGNNSTNCWDVGAGAGSSLVWKYASSCGGGYSPTTEVTYTPSGVTFAQAITVPSCTGCSSGVTSVGGTSPISSSGGATPTISCSSCLTSAVTSATGGTGVSVSGSTGAVTFSIGQAVATSSNVTFATATATGGFAVPGWAFASGAGVLVSSNGATCSGAPTASFATSFGIVTHC